MDEIIRQLEQAVKSDPSPKNLTNYLVALARIENYSLMDKYLEKYSTWNAANIIDMAADLVSGSPSNSFFRFWEAFNGMGLDRRFSYLSFMPSGGRVGPPVLSIFFECHAIALIEDEIETYQLQALEASPRIPSTPQRLNRIQRANHILAETLNLIPSVSADKIWLPQKVLISLAYDDSQDFIAAEHLVTPSLLHSVFAQ